jgi:glutathione S-transferase
MPVQTADKPTLWQIEISHYSEKVRWALEYKGIDHVRRTPLPGTHIPIALALTRGAQPTVPVLTVDGRAIGDSTAIIAALEERYPEPPLYPEDPPSAAARSSWRTTSTSNWDRTRGCSRSTS